MNEEPIIKATTTNKFLEIASVNSLNKRAWDRNQMRGKIPNANIDIPIDINFSCCVVSLISTSLFYTIQYKIATQ